MCNLWIEFLVINLSGQKVGFRMMEQKLSLIWKLSGGFELMDVDNGFYMVRFDLEEDREK